jgi:large conductance mechanosensitive channel
MLKGFRDFVMRGNVIDLAVAVIIGAAFTKVVNSLVDDIIMPPIGLLLGNVDFTNLFIVLKQGAKAAGPYATIADAKAAGAVTLNYGFFISSIVTFLIVAFVVYLLVRSVTRIGMRHDPAAAAPTKDCPYCLSKIPQKAVKCPFCTADLGGAGRT